MPTRKAERRVLQALGGGQADAGARVPKVESVSSVRELSKSVVVSEAISESLEAKTLFKKLDGIPDDNGVLASNTSTLDPGAAGLFEVQYMLLLRT